MGQFPPPLPACPMGITSPNGLYTRGQLGTLLASDLAPPGLLGL